METRRNDLLSMKLLFRDVKDDKNESDMGPDIFGFESSISVIVKPQVMDLNVLSSLDLVTLSPEKLAR